MHGVIVGVVNLCGKPETEKEPPYCTRGGSFASYPPCMIEATLEVDVPSEAEIADAASEHRRDIAKQVAKGLRGVLRRDPDVPRDSGDLARSWRVTVNRSAGIDMANTQPYASVLNETRTWPGGARNRHYDFVSRVLRRNWARLVDDALGG